MTPSIPSPSADWAALAPQFAALEAAPLSAATASAWLRQWSALERPVLEARAVLKRRTAADATDPVARGDYEEFVEATFSPFLDATARLQARLLALADWQPAADEQQLVRNFAAEVAADQGGDPRLQRGSRH